MLGQLVLRKEAIFMEIIMFLDQDNTIKKNNKDKNHQLGKLVVLKEKPLTQIKIQDLEIII